MADTRILHETTDATATTSTLGSVKGGAEPCAATEAQAMAASAPTAAGAEIGAATGSTGTGAGTGTGTGTAAAAPVLGFHEVRDLKLATLGNVDSGKSTLTSCLANAMLDDGRGSARSLVLRHAHELKKGQTSCVSQVLMGYTGDGEQVLPTSRGARGATSVEAARKTHNKDFYEIATRATTRVTMVDLCGHEKYLKSTIYGLTAMMPDCAIVVVGAERGIQKMTREHIGLCCALRIPFVVVMTKIDMAPANALQETQLKIRRILKRAGRKAFHVRGMADVAGAVKCLDTQAAAFAPVFEVSCVTGKNMDALRDFVRKLSMHKTQSVTVKGLKAQSVTGKAQAAAATGTGTATPDKENATLGQGGGQGGGQGASQAGAKSKSKTNPKSGSESELESKMGSGSSGCQSGSAVVVVTPLVGADGTATVPAVPAEEMPASVLFLLDDVFNVPGVGIVLGGSVLEGAVSVGQRVHCGPSKTGEYRQLVVRSIQRACVPSRSAFAGQHATLAVKAVARGALRREMFRKGMVVCGVADLAAVQQHTVREFEADVTVLHHSTSIEPRYTPFVHLGGTRQAAEVRRITDDTGADCVARTGSHVKVRFRFMHSPEFVSVGKPFIFREGNAKGCGRVTKIFAPDGALVDGGALVEDAAPNVVDAAPNVNVEIDGGTGTDQAAADAVGSATPAAIPAVP